MDEERREHSNWDDKTIPLEENHTVPLSEKREFSNQVRRPKLKHPKKSNSQSPYDHNIPNQTETQILTVKIHINKVDILRLEIIIIRISNIHQILMDGNLINRQDKTLIVTSLTNKGILILMVNSLTSREILTFTVNSLTSREILILTVGSLTSRKILILIIISLTNREDKYHITSNLIHNHQKRNIQKCPLSLLEHSSRYCS